jgi:CRISPR/Cas system-associated exonuclease Cas4 (RecB family)
MNPRQIPPGSAEWPLSPSQVLKYLDCSAAWHFQYVEGLESPADAGLAMGKAVHSAAAATLRAKMDGELLPAEHVLAEILPPELERELDHAELRTEDNATDLHAMAAAVYSTWHRDALPRIAPAAVEMPVEGIIAGIHVRGVVDCVDMAEVPTILDIKTAAKATTEISARHRIQLSAYAVLSEVDRVRVDTITKTKSPTYIPHSADITSEDERHLSTVLPMVADAMAQGFAIPNRTSLYCSRKGCPFWRECEDAFGGKVRE